MRRIRNSLKAFRPFKVQDTRSDIVSTATDVAVGKSLLSSKTFWVNLLGGAASVMTMLGTITFLPASWGVYLAGGLAVVNVLLRIVTGEPITSVK